MTPLSDEELISKLREAEVPEPSPLFWEHLSQRVHHAVAAEPVPSRSWSGRLTLAWAGGVVGAVAMILLAVTVSMRHQPVQVGSAAVARPVVAEPVAAGNSLPALEDDASFSVMGELASEMDFEEAGAAGLTVSPSTAENAFSQMSGDEQRAVVELLQQEIKNSKSL
jgi:hypothetical protein